MVKGNEPRLLLHLFGMHREIGGDFSALEAGIFAKLAWKGPVFSYTLVSYSRFLIFVALSGFTE